MSICLRDDGNGRTSRVICDDGRYQKWIGRVDDKGIYFACRQCHGEHFLSFAEIERHLRERSLGLPVQEALVKSGNGVLELP